MLPRHFFVDKNVAIIINTTYTISNMNRLFKVILYVAVFGGILFLAAKYFHIWLFSQSEICPPEFCRVHKTDKNDNPIGASIPKDAGRSREELGEVIPPGLSGLPIDKNPLKVLESYIETVEENKDADDIRHTQATYAYITDTNALASANAFEAYLTKNGYTVTLDKDNVSGKVYNMSGNKISGSTEQLMTVRIVNQNQFENMVSVSLVVSDINKKQ